MRQVVPRTTVVDLQRADQQAPFARRSVVKAILARKRTHRRWNLVALPFVLGALLVAFVALYPMPLAAFPAGQQVGLSPTQPLTITIAPGGFVPVGDALYPSAQNAHDPALAIRAASTEPWVAVAQNNRIVVSTLVSGTTSWQQQGGILNRGSANVAGKPSLTFAGANQERPWVAWQEDVGDVTLINAAFFNGATWNLTPLLNRDPAHSATAPVIAAGTTVSGALPLPWVTWAENDNNAVPQLVVSRAQPDNRVQGGFAWFAVGSTLNLVPTRTAAAPDLAFAGPGKTVPWVVWQESGGDEAVHIYAKRWNGTAWSAVGRQEGCGDARACALNSDPLVDAGGVRIAAGKLPNDSVAMPWLVYQEVGLAGSEEIRVLRLDPGDPAVESDDRLIPVGGAVNAQCLGNAGVSAAAANNVNVRSAGLRDASAAGAAEAVSGGNASEPDIYFVGNVPHVAWVEQSGAQATLYVCHLADARSGLERWDLDTVDGVNQRIVAAAAPSLAANATTPYIAWQETMTDTTVYVARRSPAGPAWANAFPANLTDIAGGTLSAADATAPSQPEFRSLSVPLITAAYHVADIASLEEIQLQLVPTTLATDTVPVLYARYVISDNLIYVQDPERPGNFFPPVAPGANVSNINTPYVTVEPSKITVTGHGAPSATLDLTWSLIFEDATFFERYIQAVNLIHNGGQETGFFQTGTVYVGSQIYMPTVVGGEVVGR